MAVLVVLVQLPYEDAQKIAEQMNVQFAFDHDRVVKVVDDGYSMLAVVNAEDKRYPSKTFFSDDPAFLQDVEFCINELQSYGDFSEVRNPSLLKVVSDFIHMDTE